MIEGLISVVALFSVSAGAVCSTITKWWDEPEEVRYSKEKLGRALMVSVFAGFGLINLLALPENPTLTDYLVIGVAHAIMGFGIDKAK